MEQRELDVRCDEAFAQFTEAVRNFVNETEWAKTTEQRHDIIEALTGRPLSTYALFRAAWQMGYRDAVEGTPGT